MSLIVDFNYLFLSGSEGMRDSKDSSCLSEDCDLMCTQAFSTLDNFSEKCVSGLITLEEITNLKSKKDKILDLYSAFFSVSDEKIHKLYPYFKSKLEDSFAQAHYFLYHKGLLSLFYTHLFRSQVHIDGKN